MVACSAFEHDPIAILHKFIVKNLIGMSVMQTEDDSHEQTSLSGILNWQFIKRNIVRGFKFTVAGGTGFLIAELILFIGLVTAGAAFLVEIDIVAFVTSVAAGFFINEYWTSRNEGYHGGKITGLAVRLLKFELVYALGNAVSIAVQLLLYYDLSINPLLGNIAGAIAALPVNYIVSMVVVWRISL